MRARNLRFGVAQRRAKPKLLRTGLVAASLFIVAPVFAQDAADWLQRAASAAKQLNYVGTIVYQHGGRVETSRLLHLFDASGEAPLEGAITLAFPRLQGLASAIALLPCLQQLLIGIASRRVERLGEPLRSTKVTGVE